MLVSIHLTYLQGRALSRHEWVPVDGELRADDLVPTARLAVLEPYTGWVLAELHQSRLGNFLRGGVELVGMEEAGGQWFEQRWAVWLEDPPGDKPRRRASRPIGLSDLNGLIGR